MPTSMHRMSVGVFTPFLENLSRLLDHAVAHVETRKIDPGVLLNARLYANMYDLVRQVDEANRHAVTGCALLAGIEPPTFPDAEHDFAVLKGSIGTAKIFITGIPAGQIDGTEEKLVVFTFKNGATRSFSGQSLLLTFSVPQFFFHVTTAYDILRHCGVELVAPADFGPDGEAGVTLLSPLRRMSAAAARPAISFRSDSNRCRASLA